MTDVTWQGFAFNSTTNGPTTSPVQGFNIGFYADSSGVPGSTPLYNTSALSFTEILAGNFDFFGNGQLEAIFNYSATLPLGGFTATAGTTYWLSIQGIIDSPAYWTWTSGTGGNGNSYRLPPGQFIPNSGGRGFSLSGQALGQSPVPEPSTLLMAGLGALAAIGYTSRARRRGAD